jgi:hypothetical protein
MWESADVRDLVEQQATPLLFVLVQLDSEGHKSSSDHWVPEAME